MGAHAHCTICSFQSRVTRDAVTYKGWDLLAILKQFHGFQEVVALKAMLGCLVSPWILSSDWELPGGRLGAWFAAQSGLEN